MLDSARADVISYNYVLQGTVEVTLDVGSAFLEVGDCLVLQGAQHGWNVGSQGVSLLSSIIGLGPAPGNS